MRRLLSVILVAVLGLIFLSTLSGCTQRGDHPGGRIVVVSYGGGDYQQSHIKAFLRPFEIKYGGRAESVVWGAEYGRLLEMVRSGSISWDVVEVTAAQYARGIQDHLFAHLDSSIAVSNFEPLPNGPSPSDYGAPNVYWSTVLAYRKDAFPSSPPSQWADFWDTKGFPGPRALYDDPRGTLEFALLADGVLPNGLYPLDVDRAFEKLEEIRSSIRVWWTDGTEPVNLLLAKQVIMTSAWSGRIYALERARNEIAYSWDGAANELDYWVVPRGSKNVAQASRFIAFASEAEPMARQAEMTAYGPANVRAIDYVDPQVRPALPTESANWAKSFVVNAEWWEKNEREMTERWLQWKNR